MKELSIEQKARRYDEAIEVARKINNGDGVPALPGWTTYEAIFPELKESEGELTWLKRFIKEEMDCLRYDIRDYKDSAKLDNLQRALAWVEKQGEYINFRNTAKVGDRITKSEEGVLVNLSQFQRVVKKDKKQELEDNLNKALEKETSESWNKFLDGQGEQKHTDKVEPKFKVDDWIVYNRNDHSREIIQIYDIRDGRYYFTDNVHFSWSVKECDEKCHLWTIQDAKDGDVLATLDHILIFEKLLPKDGGVSYCHYDFGCSRPQFNFNKDDNWYFGKEVKVYPATKEQRDLLFQKMKEAGYEWDAEKLELKKIQQKTAMIQWKGDNLKEVIDFTGKDKNFEKWFKSFEEYEKYVNDNNGIFKLFNADGSHYEIPVGAWIVKTPDGCNVASKAIFIQKHAWSEEDEKKAMWLVRLISTAGFRELDNDKMPCRRSDLLDWLKSLKDRAQSQPKLGDKQPKLLNELMSFLLTDCPKQWAKYGELLKSIKIQHTWKPSDEQILAINTAINVLGKGTISGRCLIELQEQLNKLKE